LWRFEKYPKTDPRQSGQAGAPFCRTVSGLHRRRIEAGAIFQFGIAGLRLLLEAAMLEPRAGFIQDKLKRLL
jgi:hypothetical protein